MTAPRELVEIRRWIAFFIVALVLSGVTAFPLEAELKLLGSWFRVDAPSVETGGLPLRIAHPVHVWISPKFVPYACPALH